MSMQSLGEVTTFASGTSQTGHEKSAVGLQLLGSMEPSASFFVVAPCGVTNIGAGLTKGRAMLQGSSSGLPRVIVLLSDGEQSANYGGSSTAITTATSVKSAGISIFAIGFGTVATATLTAIASSQSRRH